MKTNGEDITIEKSLNGQQKLISAQSDLDPKDRTMIDMRDWCEKQGDIVVLNSGLVLTSNPSSRSVQNCRILMANKGIRVKRVLLATPEIINMLLSNIDDDLGKSDETLVSLQQQRLRMLVREALDAHVSDIHIEVRQHMTRVRFRKHGELSLHAEWAAKVGREIASVAFNKETDHAITHFNPMVPQGASMPMQIDGLSVRLRLASMPAHGGFDMVMRILSLGDQHIPDLRDLGYNESQIAIINKALQMPNGAVLIAGPTGSGKTTTLASCMQLIANNRKIYTIEDPVEKLIANATQVPVNTEKEDRDFANMGKAALRMDPDVIVLGEMRDEDTAHVLVRAAITGHLVFSTVHTNSATGIVTRLVDMGVSPILLGDNHLLVCLMFQRLIPKLCHFCKKEITTKDVSADVYKRWQDFFSKEVSQLRMRGNDCYHCHGTGIEGRTIVAEVIWIDEKSRSFIQTTDTLAWEKYLRQQGWKSHKDHALDLVKQGICDPTDTEKLIGEFNSKYAQESFEYNEIKL